MVRRILGPLTAMAVLFAAGVVHGGEPLPRHDPSQHAVDGTALEAALASFAELDGALGMVVVRDGAVVGERFTDGDPASLRYDWSVTKSVTSLLVGIAIDQGLLRGTAAELGSVLPEAYRPDGMEKRSITVEHLLTMTSGLEWDERSDVVLWFYAADPLADILHRPMAAWPGAVFEYDTAACHILSAILGKATGMDEADWARSVLFGPLGISEWSWDRDPQGRAFGGHGLAMPTGELAKLGVLVLNGGLWNGRRVVSRAWIERSTGVRVVLGADFGPLHRIDYGDLWWTDRSLDHPVFLAWGWAGQFVFCVPELDLVVAANCDPDRPTWDAASRTEREVLEVIVHGILPAVRPRCHEPRRAAGRVRCGRLR